MSQPLSLALTIGTTTEPHPLNEKRLTQLNRLVVFHETERIA